MLFEYNQQGVEFNSCLFSAEEMQAISIEEDGNGINASSTHRHRKYHHNNLDICLGLNTSGQYQMPELMPYNGVIPDRLIPFSAAMSTTASDVGVHFYIDDYQFERIWRNPDRYVKKLASFTCVIGPDFSQFANMPYPMRIGNCYKNRVLSAFFQQKGVKVVPNVTWSLPDSYDYSFSGIPQHSVIAINCTSIIHCNLSKFLWYKGYNEALRRIQPSHIIRYGSKMEGERRDISTYYQNERLKELKNGR